MSRRMMHLVLAGLLAIPVGSIVNQALGEGALKIAVVDVTKVFDGYNKSKAANRDLTDERNRRQAYVGVMNKTANELGDQVKDLRDQAQKETDEKKKEALMADLGGKVTQLRVQNDQVMDELRKANAAINNLANQKRAEILDEIAKEVQDLGKAQKLDFIFDISGRSSANVPPVMYHNCPIDLTDQITKALNDKYGKAAPAPAPKTEEKPK